MKSSFAVIYTENKKKTQPYIKIYADIKDFNKDKQFQEDDFQILGLFRISPLHLKEFLEVFELYKNGKVRLADLKEFAEGEPTN